MAIIYIISSYLFCPYFVEFSFNNIFYNLHEHYYLNTASMLLASQIVTPRYVAMNTLC